MKSIFGLLLCLWMAKSQARPQIHDQLNSEELHSVFGVDSHSSVPDYDVLYDVKSAPDSRDAIRLRFRAFETDFHLRLQKNHRLISPHLISSIKDGLNSKLLYGQLPRKSDCHFEGQVISHENATVALSACSSLRGTIVMPDHFLVFSPLPKRMAEKKNNETLDRPHVIYKRSAALLGDAFVDLENLPTEEQQIVLEEHEYGKFCYAENMDGYTISEEAEANSPYIFPVHDPVTLELGLFLDSKLWEHFQREFGIERAEQELIDFSLTIINNVHVLYMQPSIYPKMQVVLVRYEIWKTQPTELETLKHKNGQAQRLLNTFCSYQSLLNPGTDKTQSGHWDHAVLLTGYDIYHTTTSVAGVAPVARMCDVQFSCSLVEGLHLGRSFVLAHEMGHNLGMVHDGVQNLCEPNRFLMSAINGAGKTTWSACSVREYNSFLMTLDGRGKNCLTDESPGVLERDHQNDLRLPGQRYTSDEQCAFFWGRDYKHEVPTGRKLSDICRILWCGNGGSTISTAHPALEGTWCGEGKYCSNGRCTPWPLGSLINVVHGAWSAWTRLDNLCSECKVNGGLRLRKEHRTCDNPAPNNGGSPCLGSSLRGIVCSVPSATQCAGFTLQQYGDRLCTSFKNDPNHPDTQLSGQTFAHHGSPCKVWCHLLGSDLIRNKANYPDGSPCGSNAFCINGECMGLGCGQEAVVMSTNDCPSDRSERQLAEWLDWSQWTSCSTSCGLGERKRNRACSKTPTSSCPGSSTETLPCNNGDCAIWSVWSAWSSCSESCGQNSEKVRSRTCSSTRCEGNNVDRQSCQLSPCPTPTWSSWAIWSHCTVTCGGGQHSRSRTCSESNRCVGPSLQSESCNSQICGSWSAWGQWSECTAVCGGGQRHSRRSCTLGNDCPGTDLISQPCNTQLCSVWTEWSAWSSCSVTCGRGQRRKLRRCLNGDDCQGPTEQLAECIEKTCPTWSTWTVWTECSVSCGAGVKRRTRGCPGQQQISACQGSNQEQTPCNTQSCPPINQVGSWTSWSECSKNCGGGIQSRNRTCLILPCSSSLSESQSCNTHNCATWESWQSWSPCSVSCGSNGTQTRSRFCKGSIGTVLITDSGQTVVTRSGQTLKTQCPGESRHQRSCSAGVICQIVPVNGGKITHLATTPIEQTTVQQPSIINSNSWSSWTSWASCSTSCGLGIRIRNRSCQSGQCFGVSQQSGQCIQSQCPPATTPQISWGSWELWAQCSVTCGGGKRQRTRQCHGRDCNQISESYQTQECNLHSCVKGEWSSWAEWTACSLSCGGGRQTRARSCSATDNRQCQGFNKEERPCNTHICTTQKDQPQNLAVTFDESEFPEWSAWSVWSACSCFSNKQARRRYCHIFNPQLAGFCLGPLLEERSCTPVDCTPVVGGWSGWSSWSSCSTNCGTGGVRVRHRMCSDPYPVNRGAYCVQQSFERETCQATQLCSGNAIDGGWSQWTVFGSCSSLCGSGYKSRTRYCTNPKPLNGGKACAGADFDLKACQSTANCSSAAVVEGSWADWSSWSSCTATCGFAFRNRQRTCAQPRPQNGGRACKGIAYMTRICTLPPCSNARDGAWSEWANWAQCDGVCGSGTRTRRRTCNNPEPANGGLPCFGVVSDRERCTTTEQGCPASVISAKQWDGVIRKWERE